MSDTSTPAWTYPLRLGDMLSNHEWGPMFHSRLLNSAFVAHALTRGLQGRAAIGTALLLWSASYAQNPAGTLPDDDVELARLAGFGIDLAGWQGLREGALYGWHPVAVEGGEGLGRRWLGHETIAANAVDMFRRKAGREQSRVEAAMAKLRFKVRAKLVVMRLPHLAEATQVVVGVAEWLRTSDLFCTEENVRRGLEVVHGVPRVVSRIAGTRRAGDEVE